MKAKGLIKKHSWDALVFFAVLALALTGIIVFYSSKSGDSLIANVYNKGNIVLKTDLLKEKEREVVVAGEHGDLTLLIKCGAIGVKESSCPGQNCVHQGYISKPGQSIICAYNAIIISLQSEEGSIIV